ncbi:MAG: hypothetical protein ACKOEC_18485 [Acidimicrobiia bacterium]
MLKIVKDSVLKMSRSLGYDIVPLRETRERDFALHLGQLQSKLRDVACDCIHDGQAMNCDQREPVIKLCLASTKLTSSQPF